MQVCDFEPKNNSPNTPTSRSAIRRRLRRRTQRVDSMRSQIAYLQRRVRELEKRLSDTTSQLRNAHAELLQRAPTERPMISHPIQCEKPLPGHQFGVTLIAAAIELAIRHSIHQ